MKYIAPVFAALSALARAQLAVDDVTASPSRDKFDWDSLPPSTALSYRSCYDGLECARLIVPMDWKNESDPRIVVLAIARKRAAVEPSDPAFAGTILTNPGGPGGSGIELMRGGGGQKLQETFDKPGKRHYEILSFDPRGVGSTWPRANCLPHNDLARDAFAYEERGIGILDGSEPSAVPRILGMYKSFMKKCEAEDADGTPGAEILGFMSTPSVARDMVQIIDKIDEQLKAEGVDVTHDDTEDKEFVNDELRRRSRGKDDVPRLQYVGYSYGTILGNYFASLFPERVGRLVLDGVVDAVDYSSGPGWVTSTIDADNITAHFYSGCYAAGASVCPLVQQGDKSAADIEARVEDFIEFLREEPLPVMSPSGGFTALTPADVRVASAVTLYSPAATFQRLATSLADLLNGNSTAFVEYLDAIGAFPHLRDACKLDDSIKVPLMQLTVNEGSIGTRCSDGEDVSDKDVAWWRNYAAGEMQTSKTFGSFWSKIRLPCSGFRFPRNWPFNGPFTTPHFVQTKNGGPVKGKPAAPLLFLSARLDPVTPLASARKMAKNHPGAAVVVQESMGHCALGSAKSDCTEGIAREYMDTGKVPKDFETVCESDFDPWRKDEKSKALNFVITPARFPFA